MQLLMQPVRHLFRPFIADVHQNVFAFVGDLSTLPTRGRLRSYSLSLSFMLSQSETTQDVSARPPH